MNNIILSKDFDVSKVNYSDVKMLDNGGKVIYVSYNNAPLTIQTPEMPAPFGMQKWTNDNRDKYTLDLSFKDLDKRPALQTFYKVLESLDSKLVEDGFKNQQTWFKGRKYPTKEVVEALYTPLIKFAKDKDTGEVTDKYPPTFKMNVPWKEGKFLCEVYDDKRNPADLSVMETKGSKVRAIIQFTGLWMAGGKFGSTWRIMQMVVVPSQTLRGFAFKPDDDDEKVAEEDIEDNTPSPTPEEKEDVKEVDEADNNDVVVSDSEDELEHPRYIPPAASKPVVKKVVMKHK